MPGLMVLAAPARADPPAVTAASLQPVTWRTRVSVSAVIEAEQNAVLGADQSGRIVAVLYRSGEAVAAGAVLVQFEDAAQAAQLALDQAKLAEARRALTREQKLLSIAGASQAALEEAQAGAAEAAAQVDFDKATLAQLQVIAPFAGTLGIRKLSAGDYVQQGQEVARITQLAPLRAMFAVPQTEGGDLAAGDAFSLVVPSLPQGENMVAGTITALSPQIDEATNARDVEGRVANNTGALLPGMYGVATLQTGTPRAAFSLPATALNDDSLGRYVFVLDPDKSAFLLRTVYVQEFSQDGDNAIIATAGLSAGQRVLAVGGFNFTDGASVTLAK